MQVRPCGPSGGTAQTDDIPGVHPLVRLDVALRQMAVECLKPVLVADDDKVSISLDILRHTDLPVESCVNRSPRAQWEVNSLMPAASADSEFATWMDCTPVRTVVLGQAVHHPDAP